MLSPAMAKPSPVSPQMASSVVLLADEVPPGIPDRAGRKRGTASIAMPAPTAVNVPLWAHPVSVSICLRWLQTMYDRVYRIGQQSRRRAGSRSGNRRTKARVLGDPDRAPSRRHGETSRPPSWSRAKPGESRCCQGFGPAKKTGTGVEPFGGWASYEPGWGDT